MLMPPLKNKSNTRKFDLESIILKENTRYDYQEIEELAASIERDGQLQPVLVEINESGEPELTAGYRRFKAHQLLVQQGKPFNQIEGKIITGDSYIIQLTENLQRDNLTPEETEKALQKLIADGMSQSDISKRLNKRLTWVSDALAGAKVREAAEEAGVNTEGLSTSTLGQLRSVPKEEIPEVVKTVKENGGTVKAARKATAPAPPTDQQHQAFYEGQLLYDDRGNKVAVIVSANGETGTVKEIK